MSTQRYVCPGERVPVIGVYSELLMHLGCAGRPITIELTAGGTWGHGALVYYRSTRTGQPAVATAGYGEAGFFRDRDGRFYTYTRDPGDRGDADPSAVQAELTQRLQAALSGPNTLTVTDLGL